jgi:hypothetical protein
MLSRDVYTAKMEARLLAWADELAWLRSKAALVPTRGSFQFQLQLAAAQGEQQSVRNAFEKLKKSGEERWNMLAAGVDVAWNALTA